MIACHIAKTPPPLNIGTASMQNPLGSPGEIIDFMWLSFCADEKQVALLNVRKVIVLGNI